MHSDKDSTKVDTGVTAVQSMAAQGSHNDPGQDKDGRLAVSPPLNFTSRNLVTLCIA